MDRLFGSVVVFLELAGIISPRPLKLADLDFILETARLRRNGCGGGNVQADKAGAAAWVECRGVGARNRHAWGVDRACRPAVCRRHSSAQRGYPTRRRFAQRARRRPGAM